ncbi:MAG: hypothetical protein GT601_17250 [Acidaminobacter sp.]|uniref:hydroxyacid dehydrogenase n=1 Tax=Acidaminobacter sp. TaxID=1872102 RepID=UPI0013800B5F|nr:hydroxyacid dehydrogenase [Acidaminobacter sp.]MZQ99415.1 hypothetical protein [Acidaminobacter sp.]
MYKVFLTEPIHPDGIELLETVAEVVRGTSVEAQTIVKEAQDCDAMLVRSAYVTSEMMAALPKLKIVAKHGIGVDNIDVEAATQSGIMVVNAPEANINAVAEHAFALIMALSKNLLFLDRNLRNGDFKARNKYPCTEIKGKVIGLIGLGRISKLLAMKIKSLDVRVIAYDPFVSEDSRAFASSEGIDLVETLDEILTLSDLVSIHVPLTNDTRGMFDKAALSKMKSESYLINVARGHIVDEDALYEALKNQKIKGAALDVFAEEPPAKDHPLFQLDNIIVSPHNAALTHEALCAMATHSAQGIVEFLSNREPRNIVNRNVLKTP